MMSNEDRPRSLLALNDDVLSLIVVAIWPKDLEAFTSTCRRIHDLAGSRLVHHRRLKSAYTFSQVNTWRDCPLEILVKLKDDPLIAHYIERLQFNTSWDSISTNDDTSYPEDCVSAAKEALAALPERQLASLSAHFSHPSTYNVSQQAAIALILSLPNLDHLRFTGSAISDDLTSLLFETTTPLPTNSQPFQQLKTVVITNSAGTQTRTSDLGIWVLAPRIQTLQGFNSFGHSTHQFYTTPAYQNHTSTLQTLHAAHCAFQDPARLSALLRPLHNLRKLKCSPSFSADPNRRAPADALWDVASFIDTLAGICANTLEVLHLVRTPCDTTLITSELLQLPNLREFEGDVIMLLPWDFDREDSDDATGDVEFVANVDDRYVVRHAGPPKIERVPSIVDMFPSSIERIVLDVGRLAGAADMLLRDVNASSGFSEKLPNLQRFSYHGLSLGEETYANLKACGVTVGRKSGGFYYTPKFLRDLGRG